MNSPSRFIVYILSGARRFATASAQSISVGVCAADRRPVKGQRGSAGGCAVAIAAPFSVPASHSGQALSRCFAIWYHSFGHLKFMFFWVPWNIKIGEGVELQPSFYQSRQCSVF